jgi:hypothetical protein
VKAGLECAAYEFDTAAKTCKLYNTGTAHVLGDGSSATTSCLLFKAPAAKAGKCVWHDKKAISDNYYVDKTAKTTIDTCREACFELGEFCSAYQFDTADTLCRIFNTGRELLAQDAKVTTATCNIR